MRSFVLLAILIISTAIPSAFAEPSSCYVQLKESLTSPHNKMLIITVRGSDLKDAFNSLPQAEKVNGLTKQRIREGTEYWCGKDNTGLQSCEVSLLLDNPYSGTASADPIDKEHGLTKRSLEFGNGTDKVKCAVKSSADGEYKIQISSPELASLHSDMNEKGGSISGGVWTKKGRNYSCSKDLKSQDVSCDLGFSLLTVDGLVNASSVSESAPAVKTAAPITTSR